jgi:hypothetical protein
MFEVDLANEVVQDFEIDMEVKQWIILNHSMYMDPLFGWFTNSMFSFCCH